MNVLRKNDFSTEMIELATQQEVIKNLMSYMDNNGKNSPTTLDEAVNYASNGIYKNVQQVVNDMVSYADDSKNGDEFLQKYCGINLYNDDTGSITGKDAGGSRVKTPESIVPESGSSRTPTTTTYTYKGLTITFPDESELNKTESIIVKGLYSWWLKGALDLVEESYGLSFQESGTTVKTMDVVFENRPYEWEIARVNWHHNGYGEATKLTLTINEGRYRDITENDVNGAGDSGRAFYLDRMLAHELTHAVMAANIDYFGSNYVFFEEGAAELVHGVDDARRNEILHLANDPSLLKKYLSDGALSSYGDDYYYGGGYMFLRYLAKQASDGSELVLPAGISIDNDILLIDNNFTGKSVNLTNNTNPLANSIEIMNASDYTKTITLAGRINRAMTIIGGQGKTTMYGGKKDDILTSGGGQTTFIYASGYGNDTITNFNSSTDTLQLYDGIYNGFNISGNNLTIKSNSGSITMQDMANTKFRALVGESSAQCFFASGSYGNTYNFDKDIKYFMGSKNNSETIEAHTGDDWVDTRNYQDVDKLDASSATDKIYLLGSNNTSMTIVGGSGNTEMLGGHKNDNLISGSGETTFWFGDSCGTDTITGFKNNDSINVYCGSISFYGQDGDNYRVSMNDGSNLIINGGMQEGAKAMYEGNTYQYGSGNWTRI